jgi:hypothetical protein
MLWLHDEPLHGVPTDQTHLISQTESFGRICLGSGRGPAAAAVLAVCSRRHFVVCGGNSLLLDGLQSLFHDGCAAGVLLQLQLLCGAHTVTAAILCGMDEHGFGAAQGSGGGGKVNEVVLVVVAACVDAADQVLPLGLPLFGEPLD